MDRAYVFNRAPLVSSPLAALPPGAVRATGWLGRQLELQAAGLTGNLDRLFEDVGPNSAWLGGDGEAWERGPYYARGLAALAYVSGDQAMIDKARPWIEGILGSQRADGDFGPQREQTEWWAKMVALQVVQIHHEATGDERVPPFMSRYFAFQRRTLPGSPLKTWARYRGGDNLDSIHWLYNRTGEASLLGLGELVTSQTHDWTSDFRRDAAIAMHVVNLSQGYKQPGILYEQSADPIHREAVFSGLDYAMKFHGRIDGLHAGDEASAGRGSVRGTELCAMVEYIHSLTTLVRILGEPGLCDRIEKVAFNSMPAAIRPDWKAHQYFAQPNQIMCTRKRHAFECDHGDDLTFGVLAGFPCCAVNMHMGWPKFVQHLWMATDSGGLAAMMYSPCEVNATAGGVDVRIVERTDYPFGEHVVLEMHPERPTSFELRLRIPGWCERATVRVNGKEQAGVTAGQFCSVTREWREGDRVEISLPMIITASTWENNTVGIERGPLAYALAVAEDWRAMPDWRRNNAQDDYPAYEVHPAGPWNYGLLVNRANPAESLRVEMGAANHEPFSPATAPIKLIGRGRRLPRWAVDGNDNAIPPQLGPVPSNEPLEEVTFLPFGCTRIRVAYLPELER